MNRIIKAGLLMLTLVIPALIFVFLQLFGTNHYALPFYNPVIIKMGLVQMVGKDTIFQKQNHLTFKSLSNDSIISLDFKGGYNLINYLPSDCSGNCELIIDQLKRVDAPKSEIPLLRIYTFSDRSTIDSLLVKKGVTLKVWNTYVIDSSSRDRIFVDSLFFDNHNILVKTSFPFNQSVLIDDNGYFRGYYKMDNLEEVDRLMAELKVLKYENNH